ncbi:MAG: nitroreductase family protein [Candidatus Bipolaricaulota bacterium]|nr:nitroreductase family protein [Candidatus Bipolaricaulota bacterium]
MESNEVLETIKERRSIFKYKEEDVSSEQIETILEAGRWAPSFANLQPWNFVVVRDQDKKKELYEIARRITLFREGLEEAPVVIAVAVDQEADPNHFVEAGAVASQNMALAAHSIGLSSYWIGVFDIDAEKNSAEKDVIEALDMNEDARVISLLPVGKPDQERTSERKDLEEIVIKE